MLLPFLSLVLAAAPVETPAEAPKNAPPPRMIVVQADKDGRLYFEILTTTKVVSVAPYTIAGGGNPIASVGGFTTYAQEERPLYLDDDGVLVYGTDGKRIEAKNLPKITRPVPALLSTDGREVDPFYLAAARPGTLIVVVPALAQVPSQIVLPLGRIP